MQRLLVPFFIVLTISGCKRYESVVETGLYVERIADRLEPIPAPPNYAGEAHWAALPWTEDPADLLPKGRNVSEGPGTADVFYLHPTIFEEGAHWNAALDSADLNAAVEELL